eukprot:jgi/Mesvir1/770/Mv17371-RA.2
MAFVALFLLPFVLQYACGLQAASLPPAQGNDSEMPVLPSLQLARLFSQQLQQADREYAVATASSRSPPNIATANTATISTFPSDTPSAAPTTTLISRPTVATMPTVPTVPDLRSILIKVGTFSRGAPLAPLPTAPRRVDEPEWDYRSCICLKVPQGEGSTKPPPPPEAPDAATPESASINAPNTILVPVTGVSPITGGAPIAGLDPVTGATRHVDGVEATSTSMTNTLMLPPRTSSLPLPSTSPAQAPIITHQTYPPGAGIPNQPPSPTHSPPNGLSHRLFPSYLGRHGQCRYPFLDAVNRGADFHEPLPSGTAGVRAIDLTRLAQDHGVPAGFTRNHRPGLLSTSTPTGGQPPPCRRSCAVVGSGASLLGLRQGPEIDAHELVIRVNVAPLAGYERDVGSRTTIRLFYPEAYDPLADQLLSDSHEAAAPQNTGNNNNDNYIVVSNNNRNDDGGGAIATPAARPSRHGQQRQLGGVGDGGGGGGAGTKGGLRGSRSPAPTSAHPHPQQQQQQQQQQRSTGHPPRSQAELYAMVAFKPLDVAWLATSLHTRGVPYHPPPGSSLGRFYHAVPVVPRDSSPFVLVHPYIVRAVRDSWMGEGHDQWPSTGMVAIMTAMMLCEGVTVYGFSSPSSSSREQYTHYYAQRAENMTGHHEHAFEREWALIDQLGLRSLREAARAAQVAQAQAAGEQAAGEQAAGGQAAAPEWASQGGAAGEQAGPNASTRHSSDGANGFAPGQISFVPSASTQPSSVWSILPDASTQTGADGGHVRTRAVADGHGMS